MPKTSTTSAVAAVVANGDADEDAIMTNNNTNEQTAKTPAAASKPTDSKTPVSSGGMTMRSGKKKKRSAFTATTPSRKRVNKRSAADVHDENNDDGGGGNNNEGTAKKRRMTKDATVVDGESDDSDEDMDDEGDYSDNDVLMENNHTATATKVRFETTKEAVAAAQLPESDEEEDEDEGEDDEEAEAQAAAAAAANKQTTGWRRLLTQRLRLPSQHTPGPVVAESPGLPPPAGGRRLIFDTGVKNTENKTHASTSTATTVTARNKLLMQTRTETGTNTNVQSSKSKASSINTVAQQLPTPPSPPQSYPLLFLHELCQDHEFKQNIIQCTLAWLALLLAFFMLGNVTNVMGDYAWDVRQQSIHWSEWYGMTTIENEVLVQESDKDTAIAETTDNAFDEEVISVVDPNLLQQARAILRAQRMNRYDIQVFENATAEMILAIKMLDSVEDELLPSSSSKSSSLPTLNTSITDPVAIIEYIEAIIDTHDVVVFSKSYCPYCKATKALFRDMGVRPTVIELDEMENGSLIHEILSQMSDQDTVPNVYVKKQHVGGNDATHELADNGELQQMLFLPDNNVDNVDNMEQIKSKLDNFNSNIGEKQQLLEYWEHALVDVEAALRSLEEGSGSARHHEVNAALRTLSEASMVPFSAIAVDVTDIHVPGEGCKGADYIPLSCGRDNVVVDVVGGVDVDALDVANDAPLLLEDAQSAYNSLVAFAQSTIEALIGPSGPSVQAGRWTQRLVKEECQQEGVDEISSVPVDSPNDVVKKTESPSPAEAYNIQTASKDIDRLLEVEDADRTGKFDYASVIHGARVLRRGPRATSLSLYESLPLINRVLAYSKLRFYGHPPEVALRPTTTMYAGGHCWSFGDEFSLSRARGKTQDGFRGEYATLTVALSQQITVTEVMIDHAPRSIADGKSALKMFRVFGYEEIGAFGEPWELGSFQYNSNLGLQTFSIPSSIGGVEVPKLRAVSLAVDSNWGAEYSCLYRFRVHGG